MVVSLILFFLIIINSLLYFNNQISIDDGAFYLPFLSILISVYAILPKIKRKSIIVGLVHILILGILYFNLPWYLYSVFFPQKFTSEIFLKFSLSEDIFVKSVYLFTTSFALVCLTYRLCLVKKIYSIRNQRISHIPNENIFLALFFFCFCITIYKVGFKTGGLFTGNTPYSYTLSIKSIQLFVIILIYKYLNLGISNPFRPSIKSAKSIIVVSGVLFFILHTLIGGDRGPVISLVLIIFSGLLMKVGMRIKLKRIPILVLSAFLFFVLMKIIQELRLMEGQFSVESFETAKNLYAEKTSLTGFSAICTNLAIEGISENIYPHSYGLLFFISLLKGIPFFGNYILNSILGSDSIYQVGSASLFTYQYFGPYPKFGLGSTYVADLYVEMGFIGVIIGSIILGIIVAYFDIKILLRRFSNFYILLLILSFSASAFYLGRSTIHGFLSNYISLLFLYVVVLFFRRNLFLK